MLGPKVFEPLEVSLAFLRQLNKSDYFKRQDYLSSHIFGRILIVFDIFQSFVYSKQTPVWKGRSWAEFSWNLQVHFQGTLCDSTALKICFSWRQIKNTSMQLEHISTKPLLGATGKRDSSESTLWIRTRGLFKADEEIWIVTDENGEEKKEGQAKMEDGSYREQDFLWYK